MTFELLIATRYLRARRKQTVISVITFIAILGVTAGVAALVVAMAVSAGQREDIQERLFGAQAHLTIYPSGPERIVNYLELTKQIEQVELEAVRRGWLSVESETSTRSAHRSRTQSSAVAALLAAIAPPSAPAVSAERGSVSEQLAAATRKSDTQRARAATREADAQRAPVLLYREARRRGVDVRR